MLCKTRIHLSQSIDKWDKKENNPLLTLSTVPLTELSISQLLSKRPNRSRQRIARLSPVTVQTFHLLMSRRARPPRWPRAEPSAFAAAPMC